ncbi:hypothetical protein [Armatimonas rosea]|uniref:Uncharacterized protein n=1 Tax=Armatimonas rosea TaxID=685828 RepID=A0A7W9SUA8_ARMRO|nr:hypothetical protein [Armatimonas rosea]MBB6052806.1 hypothetical protein [Armatimonas rosea]
MRDKDEEIKAIQEAFRTEFRERQEKEDTTGLLLFLTQALEADTAAYQKRFKESALAMAGLVVLLVQFRETQYEQIAFVLVPLGLAYAASRVSSAKRPAIVEAIVETLQAPATYTPEQQGLIRRIAAAGFRGERKLKTVCQAAGH